MLERFKLIMKSKYLYAAIFVLTLETFLRAGIVWLWNWIISSKINNLIFGVDDVPLLKGVIIISIFHFLMNPDLYLSWISKIFVDVELKNLKYIQEKVENGKEIHP